MADEPAKPSVEDLIHTLGASMDAGLREISANLKILTNSHTILTDRVVLVEKRLDATDQRLDGNSSRAKAMADSTSKADLSHDAKLADEIVARQTLATKVDGLVSSQAAQMAILGRVDAFVTRFASSPTVVRIAKLAGAVLLGWLAAHAHGLLQ